MEDRVKAGNGTDLNVTFNIPDTVTDIAGLINYLKTAAQADIAASNTATVAGTPLNKVNLLDDDVAASLSLTGTDMVPNKAFASLVDMIDNIEVDDQSKLDKITNRPSMVYAAQNTTQTYFDAAQDPTGTNIVPLTHAGGQLTVPAIPIIGTDAASKEYVDGKDLTTTIAPTFMIAGTVIGNLTQYGKVTSLYRYVSVVAAVQAGGQAGVIPIGYRPKVNFTAVVKRWGGDEILFDFLTNGVINSASNLSVGDSVIFNVTFLSA